MKGCHVPADELNNNKSTNEHLAQVWHVVHARAHRVQHARGSEKEACHWLTGAGGAAHFHVVTQSCRLTAN